MRLMKKRTIFLIWGGFILMAIAGIIWLTHEKRTETHKITVAVIEDSPAEKRAGGFTKIKNVILYIDEASMLNALDDDTVDAVLIDFLTGLAMIKTGEYSNLELAGNLIDRENTAVAFHNEDHALRQVINEALKKIIDNGTYALISHSYFGLNILSKYEFNDDQLDEIKATDNSWLRIQQSGELNVAVYENNWPFSYFDDDNELTGFIIDIAKSVCRELGIGFNPIVYPRDEIIEGLKNRYFDCIWSNITVPDSENKTVCFSNSYYASGLQLIVKKGSKIKDLDS